MKTLEKGFTLIELIVVVIIVGILATIAIPSFRNAQERAMDKDAIASVKLIQAAERIYRMENGFYYISPGSVDNSGLNTNLKLSLPSSSPKWNYAATASGTDVSTAAAKNVTSGGRNWTANSLTVEEPACSGTNCPPPP
jgi:prepilin-type N-terminal cleavage/methylation domain-containing protein